MRIWRVAITALIAAGTAAAHAAEIPETHLLLVDRHALRLADSQNDNARFEAVAKPLYRQLLARHRANLILDASAAPTHWSGLDVTAEAVAAIKAAVPEEPAEMTAAATSVRLLYADIAPSDSSDAQFHETLEHVAAGQGATLVVDRKAVVMGAPGLDITALVRSTLETYRNSGTLPLVVGGPDVPFARVAVLGRLALVQSSAAGQNFQMQVRAIARRNMDYLRGKDSSLRREGERLKARIPTLSPTERAKEVQAFSESQKLLRAEAQDRQDKFNAAVAAAEKKIEAAAGPIVLKIVADDHANMIVDRTAVVASDDALDITTPVIEKLDAALPHVEVVLDPAQQK